MLKDLIKKIKKEKSGIEDPIQQEDEGKIIFTKEENMLKMSITGNMSLHSFFEKADELNEEDRETILQLPLSILANASSGVNVGNYIWLTIENRKYYIVTNNKKFLINRMKKLEDTTEETIFNIDTRNNNFSVSVQVHDNDGSTLTHRRFDSSNSIANLAFGLDDFKLSIEGAKIELEELFEDILQDKIINTELQKTMNMESTKSIIDDYFSSHGIHEPINYVR